MSFVDISAYSYFLRTTVFPVTLTRVNFLAFTICFLRHVNKWLDSLNASDILILYSLKILQKISVSIVAFIFCLFWGYPLALLISYLFAGRYYQWLITTVLIYLEGSFVLLCVKEVVLICSNKSLNRKTDVPIFMANSFLKEPTDTSTATISMSRKLSSELAENISSLYANNSVNKEANSGATHLFSICARMKQINGINSKESTIYTENKSREFPTEIVENASSLCVNNIVEKRNFTTRSANHLSTVNKINENGSARAIENVYREHPLRKNVNISPISVETNSVHFNTQSLSSSESTEDEEMLEEGGSELSNLAETHLNSIKTNTKKPRRKPQVSFHKPKKRRTVRQETINED